MIWTSRDTDGNIRYRTADDKEFQILKDAMEYVSLKYDYLNLLKDSYSICYERRRKILYLMSKNDYPTT